MVDDHGTLKLTYVGLHTAWALDVAAPRLSGIGFSAWLGKECDRVAAGEAPAGVLMGLAGDIAPDVVTALDGDGWRWA